MFKVIDLDNCGVKSSNTYNSWKEIKDDLISFHSADCNTENWTLLDCLEIGNWKITDLDGNEIDIPKLYEFKEDWADYKQGELIRAEDIGDGVIYQDLLKANKIKEF